MVLHEIKLITNTKDISISSFCTKKEKIKLLLTCFALRPLQMIHSHSHLKHKDCSCTLCCAFHTSDLHIPISLSDCHNCNGPAQDDPQQRHPGGPSSGPGHQYRPRRGRLTRHRQTVEVEQVHPQQPRPPHHHILTRGLGRCLGQYCPSCSCCDWCRC